MPKNYYDRHDPDAEPRERRLPALHDVLGDVLEQPLGSPYASQDYPEPCRSTPRPSYDMTSHHRGPPLPPFAQNRQRTPTPRAGSSALSHYSHSQAPAAAQQQYPHSHSHTQSYSHSHSHSQSHSHSHSHSQSQAQAQAQAQAHAYHLFNYNPHQGLVHQRTSAQEEDLEPAHPRPRLPPSDPSRKYVCADCGNRFSKHSTLRNHMLTHSGEKPFECTYPGCGRRFSMACNMQRHLRTHTSASAFADDRLPSTQPSSRGGSRSSSWESSSRGGSPQELGRAYRK